MEIKKPSRMMTPGLVKLLNFVGLTNLSQEEVRDYKNLYESNYGTPLQRGLRLLHFVGLTNLSNEEIERYCDKK